MSSNVESGSRVAAAAAVRIALTTDREQERQLEAADRERGVLTAAADFGGEFLSSVARIIERAVVAARREGLIDQTHAEEGAVAGAAHEAVNQVMNKAFGLNVGGKIGISRCGDHISVCVFFGIGMLHLNDVAIGLSHRAI